MPFQPGHKKKGGRTKGSLNKKTIALEERANAMGFDPFEMLVHVANGNWKALGYKEGTIKTMYGEKPVIGLEIRKDAASDLMQYLHPKRKALEISTENPFLSGEEILSVNLRWEDDSESENEEEDAASEED